MPDVIFNVNRPPIPLKYVGDTEVQLLPCTVTDMVDQGVTVCDGRYSDEEVWEGMGIIISPTIPNDVLKWYSFTDPALGPADPNYTGSMIVDFRINPGRYIANIKVLTAPPI
jgi:hypothetical protein